jgi:hypothetical protein
MASYRLEDQQSTPRKDMSHSFPDHVHTGSETQPSSNPMHSEVSFFA